MKTKCCSQCGLVFTPNDIERLFCSEECRQEAKDFVEDVEDNAVFKWREHE